MGLSMTQLYPVKFPVASFTSPRANSVMDSEWVCVKELRVPANYLWRSQIHLGTAKLLRQVPAHIIYTPISEKYEGFCTALCTDHFTCKRFMED